MVSIIAAVAQNNVIGKDNRLLWHISADLKRFKELTSGHTVIMGSHTYLSLPVKPLPKRRNIVLSRQTKFFDGAETVSSIDEALQNCGDDSEVFIIGGESIYRQSMPLADKIYLTWVYTNFDGDTFFPEINEKEWTIVNSSPVQYDEKSDLKFAFFVYERKKTT